MKAHISIKHSQQWICHRNQLFLHTLPHHHLNHLGHLKGLGTQCYQYMLLPIAYQLLYPLFEGNTLCIVLLRDKTYIHQLRKINTRTHQQSSHRYSPERSDRLHLDLCKAKYRQGHRNLLVFSRKCCLSDCTQYKDFLHREFCKSLMYTIHYHQWNMDSCILYNLDHTHIWNPI